MLMVCIMLLGINFSGEIPIMEKADAKAGYSVLTWVSLIWIGGSAGLDGWVKTSVIYTSSAFLLLHQHSRRDRANVM